MNGSRCRLHGGLSSGPKTEAGREAIRESNRRRGRSKHEFKEGRASVRLGKQPAPLTCIAQTSGQLRGWNQKSHAEKSDALLWLAAMRTVRKCRPSLAARVDALADSAATPKDFDTPAGRAVLRANALLFSLVQQGLSSGRRP